MGRRTQPKAADNSEQTGSVERQIKTGVVIDVVQPSSQKMRGDHINVYLLLNYIPVETAFSSI